MSNSHNHNHSRGELRERNLLISIFLNILITVSQVVGGLISGSLALLSDALHNFSDVLSLIISYVANKLSKKLLALEIKIKSKVGQGVKLFGSINNLDVQKSLETNGFEIDKKQIIIAGGSIRQLGKYNANIRLHRDVSVELPFEIIPDGK